jgi:starch-binding outer membrane protein, SusD/RagB family
MKKLIYIFTIIILITSCNDDFMDRVPLAEVSPQTYFKTEAELQTYINSLYVYLPGNDIFQGDVQSDNLASKSFNQVVAGLHQVQTDAGSAGWSWDYLREVNFFLENYDRSEDIDDEVKNHYAGIARFFRAWFYFDKVKRFGDVPWYGETIDNTETDLLFKARDSRSLVMDSVMADLAFASANIYENTPSNTIDRWSALALQSRIALYEGAYRKYHGSGSFEPNYQIAIQAAQTIMQDGTFKLYSTGNPDTDYSNLYIMDDANVDEVILARVFDEGLDVRHTANGTFLTGTLLAPGLTKSLVNTYLMADGSRFTDQPGYETMTFAEETQNRDPRLAQTIRTPGYTRIGNSTVLVPNFDNARTGYQNIKYVMSAAYDGFSQNVNDLPVFRFAEVLLNFAEAKAELGQLTQADLDVSINLIRARVGMPNMTLADLTIDPVLDTRYSNVTGNQKAAILEIRRERRVELAVEGLRYDDLIRWKVAHLMAEPFKGMYFPSMGKIDLDGDGNDDIALVDAIPDPQEEIQYLIVGNDFDLENGTSGQVVMYPNLEKEFEDPKHYLFPLPRTELLLNENLTQNPGWDE